MSNFSLFSRSDFDNSGMTSTRNTIYILHIGLRDDHLIVMHDLSNIVMSSTFNDIFNLESLDAFVFRNGSAAVGANNNTAIATVLFISSFISSFFGNL